VVLVGLLLLAAGQPAVAGGLTLAKVRALSAKVAANVLEQRAPTLSVARATTARQADDALRLAGADPSAYLDRAAYGPDVATGSVDGYPRVLVDPVTIDVPAGIEFVHVTGVSGFSSPSAGQAVLQVGKGTSCPHPADVPYSYGTTGPAGGSVTFDRLVRVRPGATTFVLCGAATTPASVLSPTLVVETVAVGPTG
jgi:hypothetical protein